MLKKAGKLILLLAAYLVVLWIGFRLGEHYNRMTNKMRVEKIKVIQKVTPDEPRPKLYYIVERHDYGTYKTVAFDTVSETSTIVRFLFNEKLKPLLKLRDIDIYTSDGEKIY